MSTKKSSTPKCKTYTEQVKAIARRIDQEEAKNILDMTLAAKQLEVQALAVWDAIHAGTPDFITVAITGALNAAANAHSLPLPMFADNQTESREETLKKIADILCIARDFKPTQPTKTLAEMIVDVLEHPDCPQEIRDGLNEATSELFNRLNDSETGRRVYFTAPYIHALIVESKKQEEEEGSVN
jgi:hypothetical protein